MAEVLTSDLNHDGKIVAKRGEKLPSGLKGVDADHLRELGVLRNTEDFRFEPEGGRKMPEGLGNSMSLNAVDALEQRIEAASADPEQEKLLELSHAGKPLDLDDGKAAKAAEKEAAKEEAEDK